MDDVIMRSAMGELPAKVNDILSRLKAIEEKFERIEWKLDRLIEVGGG